MACRSSRTRRRAIAGALLALLLLACGGRPASRPRRLPAKLSGIRLLVLLVVDQLAWDTLQRYRPALRGGLARLLTEGVVFADAHHRHALTATAPGHATLVTGLTPRHHGVIANDWFDRTARHDVYSVENPRTGVVGPTNLLATALPDWVRQRDPWGRIYSASGKDRAAVLLGGKRPNVAYWYDAGSHGFVTSRYYGHSRAWVAGFDHRPLLRAHFGTVWQPVPLPRGVDAARLGAVQLDGAGLPPHFPHPFGDLTTQLDSGFYESLYDSPVIDEYLAAFARELAQQERLGVDDHLDYLGLSFTALDTVGHVYGPHSREVLDTVVRLDRELGDLLGALERQVGRDHLVVALSADHGVAPMPERQRLLGLPGVRESAAHVACVESVTRRLDAAFGRRDWFAANLYLDPGAVARSRVPRRELDRRIVQWLSACPDVARIWTRAELAPDRPTANVELAMQRASYQPQRSPDFVVQWRPWFVERLTGTTHKSLYPYDTHVPLIVRLPGVRGREIDEAVATVDLAPTLAALLGLRPPTRLDGRDLSALLLPAPAPRAATIGPAPPARPAQQAPARSRRGTSAQGP
ncbi:MAG TPA: alkaline phosphatase family protein [Thermoanaerobaculia bacterium]|nr:alkaline phosphatase family protein [Thermoanaerobaculia bacterium]